MDIKRLEHAKRLTTDALCMAGDMTEITNKAGLDDENALRAYEGLQGLLEDIDTMIRQAKGKNK